MPALADCMLTDRKLVTAEHTGDLSPLFLDIHQPGTVDVVDNKSENQIHDQVVPEVHLLGCHQNIDRLEQAVHDTTRRMLSIHAEAG